MKRNRIISLLLAVALCLSCSLSLAGCIFDIPGLTDPEGGTDFDPAVTEKRISKEEYFNKTLAGLLGQFAGFLSGYEFVWDGGEPRVGLPEGWYEFLNGPYAGNFTYFTPPDTWRYDRLVYDEETGMNKVWSDDDFHLDIFNQYILAEAGASAYAIKETWKKYNVSDWGGGGDAMMLINSNEMLPPFTGSIEGGNRYGWCTEAYIENETLGMVAPGMPNLATELTDIFASNVGYYDSVIWAKFYAAMYSLAYFETDIRDVMEQAKATLPEGSLPYRFYEWAFEAYEAYPDDYVAGAQMLEAHRTGLYRRDNLQTDPNVNGGFAILSWLYGNNSYLDTCKYSSILGYDGDCTAATCVGVMGILKGFKEGNEEYEQLNSTIYYDGEGVYHNDQNEYYDANGNKLGGYQAYIKGDNYPEDQKIDDIIAMYQSNFEKLLIENGGRVEGDYYVIPTTALIADHSYLFDNYDAEERTTEGFDSKNGTLEVVLDTNTVDVHGGYASLKLTNTKSGRVWHTYTDLVVGKTYRLSVYVKNSDGTQLTLFAEDNKGKTAEEITFSTETLINKELIFTATSSTMRVGFAFDDSQAKGDYLIFDDFMLEEIDRELLSTVVEQSLKPASNQYIKIISKPEGVKAGEQVILRIQLRNYDSAMPVEVWRNNQLFGSVMVSKTSTSATSGCGYVDIPYVFEKDSDTLKLVFTDSRLAIGNIAVYSFSQYMFR